MTVSDTEDEKLHRQVYYTTARVRTAEAGGSGVCVFSETQDGEAHSFILTNHHVVSDAIRVEEKWDSTLQSEYPQEESDAVTVEFFDYNNFSREVGSQSYQADIVAWDHKEQRDIALLKLRESEETMDYVADMLPYDERENIYMGDTVYAVGAALGYPVFQTPGEVTNAYYEIGGQPHIGINSPIAAGNCLPENTQVLTGDGYKPISEVESGDLVVSHGDKDGFVDDTVVETYSREMDDDESLIRIKTDEGHVLEATGDHRILTSGGWKKAENLSIEDEIIVHPNTSDDGKTPVCKLCGNPLGPIHPSHTGQYCSTNCSGKALSDKFELSDEFKEKMWQSEDLPEGFVEQMGNSENLSPEFVEQMGDASSIPDDIGDIGLKALAKWREENPEEAAEFAKNEEFVEQMGDASTFPHTSEIARMGAEAAIKSQWEKGPTGIERKLGELLDTIGVDYEEQYIVNHVEGGVLTAIDFALPERKIAIYADGDYWHNYPDGREVDREITEELEDRGWKVVRFWGSDIREEPSQVQAELSTAVANGASVTSVREIDKKKVYDLQVANNHNFVANGLVVHNSGGGCFKEGSDENYYYIGAPARVAVQGFSAVEHMGFIIPVSIVYEFLEDNKMECLWDDSYTVSECEERLRDLRRKEKERHIN